LLRREKRFWASTKGDEMLVHDDIYSWEGFGGRLRLASGKCRLRIYDLTKEASRGTTPLRPIVVVVSDVPESRMSVRSCVGHVATQVSLDFHIDAHRMMFIEYYPESRYGERGERVVPEKLEAVDFNWTEAGAIQPRWRTLNPPLRDAIKLLMQGGGTAPDEP
jgi:hypothetical protein